MALCGIGHRGPAADPNRGDGGQNARKQLGPDIVYLYHDRPGTVCAALCPHRRVSIIHSHRFQNAKAFPLHQPCRESFTKQSREPSFCGWLSVFVCKIIFRRSYSPVDGPAGRAGGTRQCTGRCNTRTQNAAAWWHLYGAVPGGCCLPEGRPAWRRTVQTGICGRCSGSAAAGMPAH